MRYMRYGSTEAGSMMSDVRRPRDGIDRLLRVCTIGLVVSASIRSDANAQVAATTRDGRTAINGSKHMTELTTAAVAPPTAPPTAPTARAGDESIRAFRVSFPERKITELRRRIRATQWPEKET